jgi:hypothetical protein
MGNAKGSSQCVINRAGRKPDEGRNGHACDQSTGRGGPDIPRPVPVEGSDLIEVNHRVPRDLRPPTPVMIFSTWGLPQ